MVLSCQVRVAEVGAGWVASQVVKGVQGPSKVNVGWLRLVL